MATRERTEKVRLEPGDYIKLVGVLVSMLTIAGLLLTTVFLTRTDAAHLHELQNEKLNVHVRESGHSVSIERINNIYLRLDRIESKNEAMNDNVIRIGERLGVRDLQRTGE